ncbi:MAG: NAD(P)/FAD-dependent oxidoreductase [Kineosporiaceae bacterium]
MSEHRHVVIIGAGLGGLGAAIKLRRKGIEDILLLEASDSPGGTWRDNTYPGCQCDIPSALYSLSCAPNPHWTTTFPLQAEIQQYVLDVVARFGLTPMIRYRTEMLGARWDDDHQRWVVSTSTGQLTCTVLVVAIGFLSEPSVPDLPGLDTFSGTAFHTARWNHDVELSGRRVAVVGSGASAIQVIPEIAPRAGRLDVYLRTPTWVLPHPNRPVARLERRVYAALPAVQTLRRWWTYAVAESRHAVVTRSGPLNAVARAVGRANIRRAVRDPGLAAALVPDYDLGCKRVLLSNRYYPALARTNVEVIRSGVTGVTADGLIDDTQTQRPADVIVFATGFRITHRSAHALIRGRDGQRLSDNFAEHGAYLGSTAAGFPNLFCIGGPTSGVGHTSFLFMLECQQHYVAEAVSVLARCDLASAEVRSRAQQHYFAMIQDRTRRRVWSSGCTSWFLDERGRNVAVYPGHSYEFWRRTRRFDLGSYVVHQRSTPRKG